MKAWTDLEQDKDITLYFTGLEDNPDSYWYMSPGVKIERFRDGTIELHYVYTVGDRYDPMPAQYMLYFQDYGWFAGLYKLNTDYWSEKEYHARDVYIAAAGTDDECDKREKLDRAVLKAEGYKKKLRNALKSVK